MKRPGRGLPVRLPPHAPGMRIGLYGGSFDPPHPGHRHVAEMAMRRLGLDRIWWIVTPGNPLKDTSRLAAAADRMAATRAIARHPRMAVSDVESRIGTVFTVDTLLYLVRRCPGIRFVWIMGADSLAGLHRWKGWREIARLMPIAVIDRPGWTLKAPHARAAVALARARIPEAAGARLADGTPPAWIVVTGPRSGASSTDLRHKMNQNGRLR